TQNAVPKEAASAGAACVRPACDSALIAPIPPWKPGRLDAIDRWRTTARSAVPTEPAIRWITLMELVAWATASRGTVLYATAIAGTIVLPRPRPITNKAP